MRFWDFNIFRSSKSSSPRSKALVVSIKDFDSKRTTRIQDKSNNISTDTPVDTSSRTPRFFKRTPDEIFKEYYGDLEVSTELFFKESWFFSTIFTTCFEDLNNHQTTENHQTWVVISFIRHLKTRQVWINTFETRHKSEIEKNQNSLKKIYEHDNQIRTTVIEVEQKHPSIFDERTNAIIFEGL